MPSLSNFSNDRRQLMLVGLAAGLLAHPALARAASASVDLPVEVAGVAIPRSDLARRAAAFTRDACPEFLFNHCLRTYVFGTLLLKSRPGAYRTDDAFVAALLHDLGLLPKFASAKNSFEIDGASAAEEFMRTQGAAADDADIVWHAVEMHDGKWALTQRQGQEAMLVALGAGADVVGFDSAEIDRRQVAETLGAFPRLGFKRRFTDLLSDHCRRKPTSQRATWLEGLCRAQAPGAWGDTVERAIEAAPFQE
jgi:HD domain-containing protein